MANKILQIDLQNDITPQIGSYDNTGNVTPNNWRNEDGVYSLGPTNTYGTTPYYWFTPTKEVTDFDLCWEDYQNNSQESPQYRFTIGDSAGNNVITVRRIRDNFYFGSVNIGSLAYQTWHKILIQVRKASATTSQITAYVNGKKVAEGTENVLVTSAKIALLGLVPDSRYWQNAGQRVRYVTIYDRSYSSKGVNLDGIMTTITGFVNKLKGALSTVAFSGSYNDLSNKPTISTVNDGTLTIQQNGVNVQTFTANASTNATANIQCVDLSTAQTIAGDKDFTGTTGTRDVIPATTDTYDLGSSTKEYNNAYIKALTINGTAAGDILTHNASEFIPVTGTSALAGSIVPSTDNTYDLGSSSYAFKNIYGLNYKLKEGNVSSIDASHAVGIYGGTNYSDGGCIIIYGKDNTSSSGQFLIRANNGTNSVTLEGTPSGTLTWGSKNVAMQEDVIPRSGGAVMTGSALSRNVDNDGLIIRGGAGYGTGAQINLYGANRLTEKGSVYVQPNNSTDSKTMIFAPNGTLSWSGTAIQYTSDQRFKQQISQIDDDLLTAWEDVEPVQFKYNDAVKEKSDNARLHTGYVVQQIDEACKSHGVDISKYGLYCHEVYQEETREVEQADGTKKTEVVRPANEHYSLRYTEALIVECAYLRKKLKELTARIEQLEKGNNVK